MGKGTIRDDLILHSSPRSNELLLWSVSEQFICVTDFGAELCSAQVQEDETEKCPVYVLSLVPFHPQLV